MTYEEICGILRRSGIDSPEFDAAELLSRFCGVRREELIYRKNDDFTSDALERAVSRRAAREPLQYITGTAAFYGLEFAVGPDCLCPRPDSETLVEAAAREFPEGGLVADICTGSGAIAVALLHVRPDLRAVATDISDGALSSAARNARSCGVADRFEAVRSDAVSAGALSGLGRRYGGFDALVSNPPYIPEAELRRPQPELLYEPRIALDGGDDGLDFYRSICAAAPRGLVKPGGLMIFEAGAGAAGLVAAVGTDCGLEFRGTENDLSGIARAVLLRVPGRG